MASEKIIAIIELTPWYLNGVLCCTTQIYTPVEFTSYDTGVYEGECRCES